ncbi:HUWE1-associated protein modifying stress responses [Neocloeon triangulifer]|uniref:HUWE1-associated protein modifying stress responses n=1 Tax=Neocloeon triangulifer TaxID=2078957 RepID=UPI00286F99A2|nr:HUWE1-associated protein modifying stress responses [Neocloeon triangulifer]
MSEDKEEDLEPLKYLEHQCAAQIEAQPDLEAQLGIDREAATQRLWAGFHNSAAAIAHLYRERCHGAELWLPFQTAAGTVTALYKDSNDSIRRVCDMGLQAGYQKRNKEVLSWARRRRHLIRREELIAYLAGRSLPPRPHRSSPKPKILHEGPPVTNPLEDNLNTFREALALSGATRRRSSPTQSLHELNSFISSEFARHCKRPAATSPSHDVNMDSPTHKRSRLM